MLPINSCDRWDAFALSGRLSVASIPRALPWAICFLAFQAADLLCQVPQYRFPRCQVPQYRSPDVNAPVSFSRCECPGGAKAISPGQRPVGNGIRNHRPERAKALHTHLTSEQFSLVLKNILLIKFYIVEFKKLYVFISE